MKHSKTALCMLLLLTVFLAGCGNDSPADPQPIAQGQPAAREQTGSLKEQYDSAMVLMVNEQWSRAAEMFSALSGYEDAARLTMYCKAAAAGESGDYDTAFSTFELLGDYKESAWMIQYYQARQLEDAAAADPAAHWRDWISAAEGYHAIVLFRDCQSREEACRQAVYAYGRSREDAGDRDGAVAVYASLGSDYSDAYDRAFKPYYDEGEALAAAGRWLEAAQAFGLAGDYADAREKRQECGYQYALACLENGEINTAREWLMKGVHYRDSAERLLTLQRTYDTKMSIYSHSAFLRANGTVVVAGYSGEERSKTSTWTNIIAVATGSAHTVGLRANGTVAATGSNKHSECNTGSWTDIVAIDAAGYHTVGLRADGTVVIVGDDYVGKYVKEELSRWRGMTAVAAGNEHIVGLRADGTVAVAGTYSGENDIETWTDIVAIAAGNGHAVGLRADGTVVAAGRNDYGQCDITEWTDIVAIAARAFHTVGLRADGTVVVVGTDNYGKDSGQNDTGDWTDIVAVAAGNSCTMGLRADGTVVLAGSGKKTTDNLLRNPAEEQPVQRRRP